MDQVLLDTLRNPAFSPEATAARLEAVLLGAAEATSRHGMSISQVDLAEIARAEHAAQALTARYFTLIRRLAEQRRANLLRYAGLRIVSLGYDCFSRTIPTRWGLKPTAALGEHSGPFDLSVHPPRTLIHLLRNNFEGYLDPANLTFSAKHNFCFNVPGNISFNHEVGPSYAADDFALLRAAYEPRLAHFRATLQATGPLLLLLHTEADQHVTTAMLNELRSLLRLHASNPNLHLLCLQTAPPGTPEKTSTPAPGLTLVEIAYPTTGYIWHEPADNFSDAGQAFEIRVIQALRETLDRMRA